MKKIIAVLLLFCILAINVSAASPAITVEIPNRTSVSDGQYSVKVEIKDNPGFASLQMELYYNSDVMKCTKVIAGEVVAGMLSDSNTSAMVGKRTCAIFSVAGFNNTTANGNIVTFVFAVPGIGEPKFDFSLIEVRDAQGKKIECSITVNDNYDGLSDEPLDTTPPATEPPVTKPVETEPEETKPSYTYPEDDEPENDRYDDDDRYEDDDRYDDEPDYEPDEPDETDLPVIEPEEEMILSFTDLSRDHWAYRYIGEAVSLGIIKGYPDGTFASEKEMTRAEFATVLWNLEGKPVPHQTAPFNDVSTGDWFCAPVSWAYECGYINGVSDRAFSPNGKITREQAMTILYRYAYCPKTSYTLSKFADRADVSSYAVDAMSWAVSNGIISGVDSTHIAPKAYATRAQLATIIVRYLGQIN